MPAGPPPNDETMGKPGHDPGRRPEDATDASSEKSPLKSAETPASSGVDLRDLSVQHGSTLSSLPAFIGGHRIIRLLGMGGMGTVYEAEQANPRRLVAIKVMKQGLASDVTIQRFDREADVLGRLQHSGIAHIYEAGAITTAGVRQPYFVMELVRGQTVTQYVRSKALGVRARLELVVRICEAVQYAHDKGVIHRDLKPSNILVDEHGQPKILDFGLAKIINADASSLSLETIDGQILGTLPYMSPEQARGDGKTLDTRSDIYALGVVAYEILSGRLPHNLSREMMAQAVRVICEEDPAPLSSADRDLAGDIETIVGKAMSKERESRYSSAMDLASDIRHFLADEPIMARRPSRWYRLTKYCKRHPPVVLVALLAVGVLAYLASIITKDAIESMDYYDVVVIGALPGDTVSMATGLNANCDVIGTSELGHRKRGFLWTNGQLMDLGGIGGNTIPMGINNTMEIVGRAEDPYGGGHPFAFSSGKIRLLSPTLGTAFAINNAGVTVGKVETKAGQGFPEAAFIGMASSTISESQLLAHDNPVNRIGIITAINDAGHYVALRTQQLSSVKTAILMEGPDPVKGRRDLGSLGGGLTWPTAINNRDQAVGMASLPNGKWHAFMYINNGMLDLGALPGHSQSIATAINDGGEVVGTSGPELTPSASTRGFHYNASGMKDLNANINPSSGWTIVAAHGINASGHVAATGITRQGEIRAVLLRPPRWLRTAEPTVAPPPAPTRKAFAYRVIDLGPHDNNGAKAISINNRGEIIGWCVRGGATRPLLWRARDPENHDRWDAISLSIPTDSTMDSVMPSSINNHGRIIGSWHCGSSRESQVVLWNSDKPDTVLLTGLRGNAVSINDADRLTGGEVNTIWYCDIPQNPGIAPWPHVKVAGLSSVSSIIGNGDMAGSWKEGGRDVPCIIRNGHRVIIDIPEAVVGEASHMDTIGQAVGWFKTDARVVRPFLYYNGKAVDLLEEGTLGTASALRINSKGDILMANGGGKAWIRRGGQIASINEAIDPSLGLKNLYLADINDRGEIVGSAQVPGRAKAILLIPVNSSVR